MIFTEYFNFKGSQNKAQSKKTDLHLRKAQHHIHRKNLIKKKLQK